MKHLLAIAGLTVLAIGAAPAMGEVTFKYVSAADAKKMVAGDTPPVLAETGVFSMSLHKRIVSGHPEMHMGWDEELVIQEGDVQLNYGGKGVDAKQPSPGEFRADRIEGGKTQMLHAGDIVIFPAGTWHEQIIKTPLMRYILFKTKK